MHYTYASFASRFFPRFAARFFLSLSGHDSHFSLYVLPPFESPLSHLIDEYTNIRKTFLSLDFELRRVIDILNLALGLFLDGWRGEY